MVSQTLVYRTEIDGGDTVRVEYHLKTYNIPSKSLPAILKLAQKESVQTVWFR